MKQITSLTPEQEAMIPVYVEEFKAIGLSTERANRAEAERAMKDFRAYHKLSVIPDNRYFWVNGPNEMLKKIKELMEERGQSQEAIAKQQKDAISSLNYGQYSAYWMCFRAYVKEVLGAQGDELFDIGRRIITHVPFYVSSSDTVIFIDRPIRQSFNNAGELHNPDKPAIEFLDGYSVVAFDGVLMPRWILEEPKSSIAPSRILAIDNVEQRTAAMKWYGLDAFTKELDAKVLDSVDVRGVPGMYKLLNMTIGDGVTGKYLRIVNPSTNEIHVEGVSNECNSVEDALKYRQSDEILAQFGYEEPGYAT